MRLLLVILYVVCASGCATIGTGPFLGSIPTGMRGLNELQQGGLYHDPEERFTAIVPQAVAFRRTRDGVIFNSTGMFAGEVSYIVFVYDRPPNVSIGQSVLDRAEAQIQLVFEARRCRVEIVRQKQVAYRNLSALDVQFFLTPTKRDRPDRLYISRFVEVDSQVYWMYYSRSILRGQPTITDFDLMMADRFFDGVTFSVLQGGNRESVG